MKKLVSVFLTLALVLGLVGVLTACGKTLSGDYALDATTGGDSMKSGLVTTYSFSGSKVTLTLDTYLLGMKNEAKVLEGTYKIAEASDGTLEITFSFVNDKGEEDKEYSVTSVLVEEEDAIKIGILTFKKV